MVDLLLLGFVIYTKALANVPICFARNNLSGLTSNIISNVISKFDKKKMEKELWEQGKELPSSFQIKIWIILLKL